MESAFFLSALAMGFFSSFHCIGMCGPLTLMLPADKRNARSALTGKLCYNLGRIITYGGMGMFSGSLGKAMSFGGFQREFAVMAALMILLTLVVTILLKRNPLDELIRIFWLKIFRQRIGKLGTIQTYPAMLGIGMLNGILPCGLVYLALTAAATEGTVMGGMLYMYVFGIGTIPAMLAAGSLSHLIKSRFRVPFHRLLPVVAVALACLLFFRGTTLCHSEPGDPIMHPGKEVMCSEMQENM